MANATHTEDQMAAAVKAAEKEFNRMMKKAGKAVRK